MKKDYRWRQLFTEREIMLTLLVSFWIILNLTHPSCTEDVIEQFQRNSISPYRQTVAQYHTLFVICPPQQLVDPVMIDLQKFRIVGCVNHKVLQTSELPHLKERSPTHFAKETPPSKLSPALATRAYLARCCPTLANPCQDFLFLDRRS